MTRHPVDWLSLIVGALGVLVAVSLLTDLPLGSILGDVGPLAAVVVGLAVLGAALRGARSPHPAAERPARQGAAPAHAGPQQPTEHLTAEQARAGSTDDAAGAPTGQVATVEGATARDRTRDATRELDAPSRDGDDTRS